MDSNSATGDEVCLDIAIDHRLRKLFRPITRKAHRRCRRSNDLKLHEIAQLNDKRVIEDSEIHVTCQLFNSGWSGGITAILLQPANYHPYWNGIDAVIENCATLKFIDEAFDAVTRGTLRLGSSKALSLIDSAPYIQPNDEVSEQCKRAMQQMTSRVICGKEPDGVISMWRDPKPKDVPSEIGSLHGLGIGKTFLKSSISFNGHRLDRVNSFHPSYTANYQTHASCFRQLLLLNIAEACTRFEHGTWHEEGWMKKLKEKCASAVSYLRECDTSDTSFIYGQLKLRLNQIQEVAMSKKSISTTSNDEYDSILQSGISEAFTDASLCLKEIWLRYSSVHPDDIPYQDIKAISSSGKECLCFLKRVVSGLSGYRLLTKSDSGLGYYNSNKFAGFLNRRKEVPLLISGFMKDFLFDLNLTFSRNSNNEWNVDFQDASKEFLSAAVKIENLLSSLKGEDQEVSDLSRGVARIAVGD